MQKIKERQRGKIAKLDCAYIHLQTYSSHDPDKNTMEEEEKKQRKEGNRSRGISEKLREEEGH